MNRDFKIHLLLLLGIACNSLMMACSSRVRRPVVGKAPSSASNDQINGDDEDIELPKIDLRVQKDIVDEIMKPSGSSCPAEAEPPAPKLRLLTRVEYSNSIRDLFGLKGDYASEIPNEIRILGFKNNADTNVVSDAHMDAYLRTSKKIADEIDANRFQQIAGCSVSAGEVCAKTAIPGLASRIWRRPVTADESGRLMAIYKTGAGSSSEAGFQLVLRAMLSSPFFIYRNEIGLGGSMTAHETAEALSYSFWATVPDDELRQLADSGELLKNEVKIAQGKRLLASPKATAGIRELIDGLIEYGRVDTVGKDAQKFPLFTPAIRKAMIQETEDSFDYWVRTKQVKFQDLFSADYTVGRKELADFYKAELQQDGEKSLIRFTSQKRRGLLGLGSFLAGFSASDATNPIKRGVFVREHLLCEIMLPPDTDIPPLPVAPGLSTRERFAQHTSSPSCKSCHVRIDGVGFGMEDFDAVGIYRDQENNKAIDASGDVFDLDGKESNVFNGSEGLSDILKSSDRAKRCLALQAFREASGRLETRSDICALRSIGEEFVKSDLSISDLLIRVITNDNLSKRKGL